MFLLYKEKKRAALIAAFLAVAVISFFAGRYNLLSSSKLLTISKTIEDHYALDFDKEKATDYAAWAYAESLGDPYTEYFNSEEFRLFNDSINSVYHGLGVTIDYSSGSALITDVAEDSSAEKAGILPGDILVSVDGRVITEENYGDVVNYIRGYSEDAVSDDTEMEFTVSRGGEESVYRIKRSSFHIPPVAHSVTDEGVLYVTLSVFSDESAKEFSELMGELNGSISAIILDLRNNGGGQVSSLITIASELMPEGPLFSSVNAKGKTTEYKITDNNYSAVPLAVLVNGESASASEILSAAIKQSGRGVLIGTTTYGKGLVQTIITFGDGSALKYTDAKYYTYDGSYINEVGVEPDITVEGESEQYDEALSYVLGKI